MNKIPVGKTIKYAYTFTFENLGAIIGLIWIPTVLITVGGFFAETSFGTAIVSAMRENRPAVAGQAMISLLAWYFVSLLLTAVASAAVSRQALGLRKGPAVAHFALGPAEFRVFGAELALFGVLLALAIPYLAVLSSVVTYIEAGGAAATISSFVAAALAVGGICLMLLVVVRLSFLLVPATIAENAVALARSWALTRGNFWRIVAVGLCTFGPIVLVLAAGEYAILGPHYFELSMSTSTDAAVQAKIAAEQTQIVMDHLPMSFGLSLLMAPFYFGLLLAPSAYAYRALSGQPAP
ncbi:MAG: hypothetical protein ACREHE_07385 [Rhizomicrobium sp.]